MSVDVKQAQDLLNTHGFPCGEVDGKPGQRTRSAAQRFQRAFAHGRSDLPLLQVDGELGSTTMAALRELPWLSPHFKVDELRSRGDKTCHIDRSLLIALELLREQYGRPITLRSGYRDPDWNRRQGGATHSMHMYGVAADVALDWTVDRVKALGIFSGIGYRKSDRTVRHVDLRHLSPANRTRNATPRNPQTWEYPA